MTEHAMDIVRPLVRTRQVREFTDQALTSGQLDAIVEVARWTGSSKNEQPWRFIVTERRETLDRIAEAGQPQTRPLRTAMAAIAIVLPDEPELQVSRAYDEGRAAERILVAASMLGIAGGVTWVRSDVRAPIGEILSMPDGWFARTIVALGHPTETARLPKSAPGTARRPRGEMVYRDRWQG